MSLIYLVRHAQTERQAGVPSALWPLSALGREQAEKLSRLGFWQRIGRVYTSPEAKAVATVAPAVSRYRLPLITIDDLRELERPLDGGMSQAEYVETVAACFRSPEASVRGWESAGAAQARIRRALVAVAGDTAATESAQAAAVVSHGLVLALFLAALGGRPAPEMDEWRSIPIRAGRSSTALPGSWCSRSGLCDRHQETQGDPIHERGRPSHVSREECRWRKEYVESGEYSSAGRLSVCLPPRAVQPARRKIDGG